MAEFQPTLPAPVPFTEQELNFQDEEPPGIFPENQNSNWGLRRKIFSDMQKQVADQLEVLWLNTFVSSSTTYLDRWEMSVGLPPNPANRDISGRQAAVLARLRKGHFSRPFRDSMIAASIQATFGDPVAFYPEGISLEGGIPLFAEKAPPEQLFRVYEDVRNFSFEIWIKNTVDVDLTVLNREMKRVSPYVFTISAAKANVLDYFREVRNKQPVGYWRLGNLTDSSGYGNSLTLNGSVAAVASPGLLDVNVAGGNGAYDFSGGFLVNAVHPALGITGPFTLVAWVNLDTLPASGGYSMPIINSGYVDYIGVNPSGALIGSAAIDSVQRVAVSSTGVISAGVTYKVETVWDGTYMRVRRNGVEVARAGPYPSGVTNAAQTWVINGAASGFPLDGKIDEAQIYNYAVSDADSLRDYNTGRNIP